MKLVVLPRHVVATLGIVILLLAFGSVATAMLRDLYGRPGMWGLAKMWDVGDEQNIPTWYASGALALAAGLLVLIAAAVRSERGRYFGHWLGMSIIFAYLSLDEFAALHERLNPPLRALFNFGSRFVLVWTIPFGILALLVAAMCLGFLASLPPRIRTLFVTAGALFVGGAIGGDIVSGYVADVFDSKSFMFLAADTLEEVCEMAGILVFNYALLAYMAARWGEIRVRLTRGPEEAAR